MDPFNIAPYYILDLIFLKLNEEDLHETLRVSKSWFWASVRRTKKLKITSEYNHLKSMAEFYNKYSGSAEMDWCDLFKHLVLDELVVNCNTETANYLVNNGCNTAVLYIGASEGESPVTLGSLKKFSRLQSFEYHTYKRSECHPFIAECFNSSDSKFDPNIGCLIFSMKLSFSSWNTEDPVLMSITKLDVCEVTIGFLRLLVALCPNLGELHCSWGDITQDWHQIFPANVKRIELKSMRLDNDVAAIVDASTDSARHLLPYLCQNWESVDKFYFDGYNYHIECQNVYEAFPQQREEVFGSSTIIDGMNFASPLFQSREICVECDSQKALQLKIPPTKGVKFEFRVKHDFTFSPRAACLEPGKVEHLDLSLRNFEPGNHEPFRPRSFAGFTRLTCLTLSRVGTLSIKMALDQCPSIKELRLVYLNACTIGNIPVESNYANVCELVLMECEEPLDKVFKVFPCLSGFKHLLFFGEQETHWLWRHLVKEDKSYGVVFESEISNWYIVSDDLQASLNQAQKLLKDCFQCECYLKGFKLIPRVATQQMSYLN